MPQEQLLVAAVRRSVGSNEPLCGSQVLGDPEGRLAFYQLAQSHGVLGLALRVLEQGGSLQTLPERARRDLLDTLGILKRQALLWDMERERLLTLLSQRSLSANLGETRNE